MAGNEIHVLLHKSIIRFFWDRSIGKQAVFDAIGEQVGRAKGFFGQKPEGICLSFANKIPFFGLLIRMKLRCAFI